MKPNAVHPERRTLATETEPQGSAPEESRRVPDLLEQIAEAPPIEKQTLPLASGRVIEARAEGSGEDRVTIRSPTGEVELEVRMTARGPVLRFRAADLELASAGKVEVSCDRFHVQAKSAIVEETGGDLRQRVGGNADIKVRGRLRAAARETQIAAKRGNVQIEANDDVEIVGERVKLNC